MSNEWRVEFEDGTETTVTITSNVSPEEDEFGELIAKAVKAAGKDSDLIDDWWPLNKWAIDEDGKIYWNDQWIGIITRTPDRDGRHSTRFLIQSVQSEDIDAMIGLSSTIILNPSDNPD